MTRVLRGLAVMTVAVAAAGCSQPGVQAPRSEAAKIDVAASRMSVACGYEEELTSFGHEHPKGLGYVESIADSGARKLAAVFHHDQTGLYQGESVGGVVHDSISLLAGCRLRRARAILEHALATRH